MNRAFTSPESALPAAQHRILSSGDTALVVEFGDTVDRRTSERVLALFERLSAGSFCRCHASFIVDLRYVTAYNRTEFVMSDGRDIPISRAFSAPTKQAFSRFIGDQI